MKKYVGVLWILLITYANGLVSTKFLNDKNIQIQSLIDKNIRISEKLNEYETESECENQINYIQNLEDESACNNNLGNWVNDDEGGGECICDWTWIQIDNEEDCTDGDGVWGNDLSASNVVNEILPAQIINRPKTGFNAPIVPWIHSGNNSIGDRINNLKHPAILVFPATRS